MFPPVEKSNAPQKRREKLRRALGDLPALIPAGAPRGRNYAGNPYPFRASSHFIYFLGDLGAHLPRSWLLLDEDGDTLFTPAPSADDALWHGPTPSLAALSELGNVTTRDVAELDAVVRDRRIATLPAPDGATRMHQRQLLGRIPDVQKGDDLVLVDAVISLRLFHDDHAVAGLEQAAAATAAAHRAGMAATAPGRHEWHVRAAMEQALMARGMGTAYPSIVTVHGEVLHNNAYHHPLEAQDLLLADVGAETAGGWAGDVTRTWPVSGTFSPTQRDIYNVVLQAQKRTIEAIRPMVRYRDLHLKAAETLAAGLVNLGILLGDPAELVADDVHAMFFPHGVGHLIGLDVHDMEDLGDRAGYQKGRRRDARFGLSFLRLDRDLLPGMAVTIEPGFYNVPALLEDETRRAAVKDRVNWDKLAQFADVRGIRIEDDVLLEPGGPRVLTADIPKEIPDVEAAVNTGAP